MGEESDFDGREDFENDAGEAPSFGFEMVDFTAEMEDLSKIRPHFVAIVERRAASRVLGLCTILS